MYKIIQVVLFILILCSACDYTPQKTNGETKSGGARYTRVCIDGVEYLQKSGRGDFTLAPHFKPDGNLYLCPK